MRLKAAITVRGAREEVERRWRDSPYRPEQVDAGDAAVTFADAPSDRGTEIHVALERGARGGRVGEAVGKAVGKDPLAKVKDQLRHFKQDFETGEIARSDAVPEGELAERKLKQRPGQPLSRDELDKAGAA